MCKAHISRMPFEDTVSKEARDKEDAFWWLDRLCPNGTRWQV